MAFELGYAFTGSLKQHFADKEKATKLAATKAMLETAAIADDAFEKQIRQNFRRSPTAGRASGQRLEKAVVGKGYPDRRGQTAIDPGAIFVAKPDWMPIFVTGGGILAGDKRMVIALPAARRLGLEKSFRSGARGNRLRKWGDIAGAKRLFGKLHPIHARNGDIILAADTSLGAPGVLRLGKRKKGLVPLFLLVRSVIDPKLFDFEGPIKSAVAGYDALVEKYYKDPK